MTPKGCKSCEIINSWGDWIMGSDYTALQLWNCPMDLWNVGIGEDGIRFIWCFTKPNHEQTNQSIQKHHFMGKHHFIVIFCFVGLADEPEWWLAFIGFELSWGEFKETTVMCTRRKDIHTGRIIKEPTNRCFCQFFSPQIDWLIFVTKLQVPELEIQELRVWRVEPMFRCVEHAALWSAPLLRNLSAGCQIFFDPDPGSNWNLATKAH